MPCVDEGGVRCGSEREACIALTWKFISEAEVLFMSTALLGILAKTGLDHHD